MGNNYWGLTSTDGVSDQELLFCWVWVPPSTGHANLGIDKPCLKEVWTSATKHVLISKVGTEIICIYVHLSYHVYVPCYLFFVVILWSWWSYQLWYIIILSICEKYTVNILYIYIYINIYIWLWFRLIYYQSLFIILWSDYDSTCITVIFLFIYDTPTDSQQKIRPAKRKARRNAPTPIDGALAGPSVRHSDVIISNILNTR